MTSLVHDYTFGCVSWFWQDLQDLTYDRMVLCIPFQNIKDVIVSSRHKWLGISRELGKEMLLINEIKN
jgi:hypothetical protein